MDARPELDAVICLLLQHRPHATATELAPIVTGAGDREVTESLQRLRTDGLVRMIDDAPPRYAAKVTPEAAAAVLSRPGPTGRRPPATPGPAPVARPADSGPEILVGSEESRRAAESLQRGARREVLVVDRPPCGPDGHRVERDRLREGVRYRVVYDRSVLGLPGRLERISELVGLGEAARTASGVPMKMLIVDRTAALIPLQANQQAVERSMLVRTSSLLAALLRIFADLWRSAVPFGSGRAGGTPDQPTDEERQILALLASGATDESIGRLMGFSARTAHRRVRELTAKLGVTTRFQAGVQAVRLGWL